MMQTFENRFGTNEAPIKPIEWLTNNGNYYTAVETRSFAKLQELKPITTPVTTTKAMACQKAL